MTLKNKDTTADMFSTKRVLIIAILLVLTGAGIGFFQYYSQNNEPHVILINQNGQKIKVFVEIVDTPDSRAHGLMDRDYLGKNNGMLFLMDEEEVQSFWMKNTRIPLDMIFIFSDWKIAGIIENTTPYSLEPRSIEMPSKYVLEVNGGFCQQHNIKAGDKVIFNSKK